MPGEKGGVVKPGWIMENGFFSQRSDLMRKKWNFFKLTTSCVILLLKTWSKLHTVFNEVCWNVLIHFNNTYIFLYLRLLVWVMLSYKNGKLKRYQVLTQIMIIWFVLVLLRTSELSNSSHLRSFHHSFEFYWMGPTFSSFFSFKQCSKATRVR